MLWETGDQCLRQPPQKIEAAIGMTPDRQELVAISQFFNDISDRDNLRFIKKIGGSSLSMQQIVTSTSWPSIIGLAYDITSHLKFPWFQCQNKS
jgi:hypothetical protein